MRLPRFITNSDAISWKSESELVLKLPQNDRHHLERVLRKKAGDSLSLFIEDSKEEISATVLSLNAESITLSLIEKRETQVSEKVLAIIGVTKSKTLDLIAEKLTEIGVNEIHFFRAKRSQYEIDEKRLERLQRITDSAIKQSGSFIRTTIHSHASLQEATKKLNLDPLAKKICLSTNNDAKIPVITEYLSHPEKNHTQTSYILIGCEGGLDETELEHASEHSFAHVSLGKNILRTETAAILACALVKLY